VFTKNPTYEALCNISLEAIFFTVQC